MKRQLKLLEGKTRLLVGRHNVLYRKTVEFGQTKHVFLPRHCLSVSCYPVLRVGPGSLLKAKQMSMATEDMYIVPFTSCKPISTRASLQGGPIHKRVDLHIFEIAGPQHCSNADCWQDKFQSTSQILFVGSLSLYIRSTN